MLRKITTLVALVALLASPCYLGACARNAPVHLDDHAPAAVLAVDQIEDAKQGMLSALDAYMRADEEYAKAPEGSPEQLALFNKRKLAQEAWVNAKGLWAALVIEQSAP